MLVCKNQLPVFGCISAVELQSGWRRIHQSKVEVKDSSLYGRADQQLRKNQQEPGLYGQVARPHLVAVS